MSDGNAPSGDAPPTQVANPSADAATPSHAERKRAAVDRLRPKRPDSLGGAPGGVSSDDSLAADELDALPSDGRRSESRPASAEETVRIGDVDVPISALSSLPDDVLKKVKRKIRAAGKEREITLAEALEAVPKAEGWQQRLWQAQQREQTLETIAQRMQSDPLGALTQLLGGDRKRAREVLEQRIYDELTFERMSPEEQREHLHRLELEEKARRFDEYDRAEKQRREQAMVTQAKSGLQTSINGALARAGLPQSAYATQRMASTLDAMLASQPGDYTLTDEDFSEAARIVAQEYESERGTIFDGEGDAIIARIGEENARKIARAYAQRVRASQQPPARPANAPAPRPSTPNRRQSWDEWRAEADRRQGLKR